jgi:2-haloacid dehalogenase
VVDRFGASNGNDAQGETLKCRVAAHNYDHRHARSHGMRTGYVNRPTEFGPSQIKDIKAEDDWDIVVNSFTELADMLLN